MAQVVQAKCPQCQKTLRIPVAWIGTPLRCKHCHTVIRAKPRPAPAPTRAARTRPDRPAPPAAAVAPGTEATLPDAPARAAPEAATAPESTFAFTHLDSAPPHPPHQPAQRRSRGGWWKGALLGAVVGALAVATLVLCWPLLRPLISSFFLSPFSLPSGAVPAPAKPDVPTEAGPFPRRLLAVCVSDYWFANPVNYGGRGRHVGALLNRLGRALKIAPTQVIELSDSAAGAARPPLKPVIEGTIAEFLDTSRAQDRVVVLFLGHAVEIDDAAYLVPVEGELGARDTLIPLAWLYDRLARCRARQKVLVLDVCRQDPSRGSERPGGGPLGAKLDAALQDPPAGVQVWSACTAGQFSYEFENTAFHNGVFLDELFDAVDSDPKNRKRVNLGIQQPDDPLPLDALARAVNGRTEQEVARLLRDGKQTPRLSGQEAPGGAAYDPHEPPPAPLVRKPPPAAFTGPAAGLAEVQSILQEIDEIPPVKMRAEGSGRLRAEALPPFSAQVMREYRADLAHGPLRDAVRKATDVLKKHARTFPEEFRGRGNPTQIKEEVKKDQKEPGLAFLELKEALTELIEAGAKRADEPSRRWQANYDYVLARLSARVAYVYEYNWMLGQIRLDRLPELTPGVHHGWRMASREKVQSGGDARKLAAEAHRLLDKVAQEHPGTPWALLAKRERLTALGLEWQPTP